MLTTSISVSTPRHHNHPSVIGRQLDIHKGQQTAPPGLLSSAALPPAHRTAKGDKNSRNEYCSKRTENYALNARVFLYMDVHNHVGCFTLDHKSGGRGNSAGGPRAGKGFSDSII
ncbi:hypothetical protein BaRGS_00032548 [Batillaria attramentaria]|uniref:Uncharacterized protein n=1 Tax=Batillaria attramentaria TaxID=370345 RepID=A0ABD0JMG4_9CAEN